jgi:hypothetical protein
MNVITAVHFALMLLLVGGVIRFVEYKFPDSAVGQALAVIY